MKTYKLLLAFIFIINYSFAQNGFTNKDEAKNVTDANGLKQGKWIEYLNQNEKSVLKDSAKYYKLLVFKDDKSTERERTYYYPSGKPAMDGAPIKNGKYNGIAKWYYETGKLKEECNYSDGQKNGINKHYYESGKLKTECTISESKGNGILKGFYEDGKVNSEIPMIDGKRNGIAKWYYENGKLKNEATYVDGNENGIAKGYYESGKLGSEETYTNGKLNGNTKWYYENGKLSQEKTYTNGKLNGNFKVYDENGSLNFEENFTDGKKIQTAEDEQNAKLRYQMAMEEYESKDYGKAIENLYKIEELDTNAITKTSYLIAKCWETYLYKSTTAAYYYDNCLKSINYYIQKGKDEEKKTELRKIKITIEDSPDYNQKKNKTK